MARHGKQQLATPEVQVRVLAAPFQTQPLAQQQQKAHVGAADGVLGPALATVAIWGARQSPHALLPAPRPGAALPTPALGDVGGTPAAWWAPLPYLEAAGSRGRGPLEAPI